MRDQGEEKPPLLNQTAAPDPDADLQLANKKKAGVAAQSALNAVVGDQLARDANPLGIKMQFRQGRDRFSLAAEALAAKREQLKPGLLIFVHGLGNSEQVWEFPAPDDDGQKPGAEIDTYGSRLAADCECTPLYLRYNTGRPIEENGALFAQLMQQLVANYPLPVTQIVLIGHSMGGLVMRHAQQLAMDRQLSWLSCLSQCIYIGSPHEGANLEKFASAANSILGRIPRDHMSIWSEWIDLRSTGIKDLNRGVKDHAEALEFYGLYPPAQHRFISGSVGADNNTITNELLGDGLVRQSSAQPQGVPENCTMVHLYRNGHISLTISQAVYDQIEPWVKATNFSPLSGMSALQHQPPDGRVEDEPGEDPLTRASGAVDLTGKLFGQVVDTVGRVQRSVANEVYDVLGAHPSLGKPVKAVKTVHEAVADAVNKSTAAKGQLGFGAAKWILDAVADGKRRGKESRRTDAGDATNGTDTADSDTPRK